MEIPQEIAGIGMADWIIVAIVACSTIYSLIKGFIKEAFFVIAMVVGLIVATRFYVAVRDLLLPWLRNLTISSVVGFLVLFFLVAVLLVIVGNAVSKMSRFMRMGVLDRLLGGILGVFKGILICGMACMIILTFLPTGRSLLEGSILVPRVMFLTKGFFSLLPKEVKERLEWRLRQLNRPREVAESEFGGWGMGAIDSNWL